jgi:GNAT superfamily N-acetyltransferase
MIEFRLADRSDVERIAALHTRSWHENYRGNLPDEFLDGDLLGERRGVWQARLDSPSADQFVLLAVDGPSLLGFVCAYGGHDAEWGSLIDNLHVAHASKRGGIGSSLMRQAGSWLESRYGDLGVYLWVWEPNSTARSFYEHLGARNAGASWRETHGGGTANLCRYVWPRPERLVAAWPVRARQGRCG